MFRPRFRLITLFVVVSLVAIGAAAYGTYQRSIQAERQALVKISNKGASIRIHVVDEGQVYFPEPNVPQLGGCGTGVIAVYGPAGSPQDFADADLALFDDVHRKLRIDFTRTRVTPTAIKTFQKNHPQFNVSF